MWLAAPSAALALLIFQFGARWLYGYALTSTHVEVRLFGRVPVYRVSFNRIERAGMSRVSITGLLAAFTTLRFGNRIFGQPVTIVLRGRFPRRIIITPDQPPQFVTQLRERIIAVAKEPSANA